MWLAECRLGQEALCERGVVGGLAGRAEPAKDGSAAGVRSEGWWPQGWLAPRAFKEFMKNDIIAHGGYLASPLQAHTQSAHPVLASGCLTWFLLTTDFEAPCAHIIGL